MTPPSPPTRAMATAGDAGRTCPYCRFSFKQGVALARCPACAASHHEDCWIDNGGCAIVGCGAAPAAPGAAAATPSDWGPPATTAMGSAPPPPPPPPRPPAGTSRLRPNALAIGFIAVALTVGAIAATIALTGGSPNPTTAQGPAGSSRSSSGGGDDGGDAGADQPTQSVAQSQTDIVAVLRRYETAYSNRDTEALRFVFTPGVTRHGLAHGGCGDASGRAAVLLQYRQQFALKTGIYTLHGLSPDAIGVDGATASTDLRFSIAGGNSGRVSFTLARFAGVWRVSHVDSHC